MNEFEMIRGGVGNEMYKTPCNSCKKPVFTWMKRQNIIYKCKPCRVIERQQEKEKNNPLRTLEAERRLEIAIEYLEKKDILEDYSKALDIIGEKIYRTGWFQSSNEILVALEIIRKGYKVRHQVKMGKWKVDFQIPELKTILEIDGVLYHNKETKPKEKLRDSSIIAYLGPEWEVIRINENLIKKNIQKLIPAIKRIIAERKRVRSSYEKLPNWYNDNQV
jgi:very-short-patch-repair endonuclease